MPVSSLAGRGVNPTAGSLLLTACHPDRRAASIHNPESVDWRVAPQESLIASPEFARSGKVVRRGLKGICEGAKVGDLTTLEDGASVEEVKKAVETMTASGGR